jgi:hypothetical protein
LVESRCIHQKQTAQQRVPVKVIQKSRFPSFIFGEVGKRRILALAATFKKG